MSYIALANITLSSAQSSVTFSSIPTSVNGQNLRDLILIVEGQASSNTNIFVRFNSDATQTNYNFVFMLGAGSSSGTSGTGNTNGWGVVLSSANGRSINHYQIMDYSATDKHKTTLLRTSQGNGGDVIAYAGRWANNNAINTVAVFPSGGVTFSQGMTLALYGIAG